MVNSNSDTKVSVRDKHFAVSWSVADSLKVEEYTRRLVSMYGRAGLEQNYTEMADQMITLLQRRGNDHHNATADLAGHDWLRVDPIDAHIGDDLCTFQGLNKLLKIYLGTASGVFKWVARSLAAGTPTPYTIALNVETGTRQDATSTGFHDVKGSSIRIFSTYAASTASADMYQLGVFDASSSGTLLAIHDFGGTVLAHVQNTDGFSLGMIIDFAPFGDVIV